MAAHGYRYGKSSALDDDLLDLRTSGGDALRRQAGDPVFYAGFLTAPAVFAAGLCAVARCASTRYFQAGARSFRDPVVTSDGTRLRFESLSGCAGVHARLDVLPDALDGLVLDVGTTNVDVGEPLRRMLSRVTDDVPLRLSVGPGELVVTTQDGSETERRVDLPDRWLRSFAELQVITAGFEPRLEMSAAEAGRFLRSLPVARKARGCGWIVPSGRSARSSSQAVPGAVCVAGPQRLDTLLSLLPRGERLRVYGPAVTRGSLPCASAWELELPGMRYVVTLSPELGRGFSGEGAALTHLADDRVAADAETVVALLEQQAVVEPDVLVERSGLSRDRVRAGLVALGASGLIGYDLAEAAYFRRVLPYESALVARSNPRLRDARALVESGEVVADGDFFVVNGYRVRGTTCTCRWWTEHRGGRGECKHVLAASMVRTS